MKTSTRIVLFVLSLLGFTSCQNKPVEMYATPRADFKINVTVNDKTTGQGIKTARVIVKYSNTIKIADTLTVNEKGMANVILNLVGARKMDVTVVAEDMGELAIPDKLYKADSVEFHVDYADFKGGDGGWYEGEFTKNVKIELEKEK